MSDRIVRSKCVQALHQNRLWSANSKQSSRYGARQGARLALRFLLIQIGWLQAARRPKEYVPQYERFPSSLRRFSRFHISAFPPGEEEWRRRWIRFNDYFGICLNKENKERTKLGCGESASNEFQAKKIIDRRLCLSSRCYFTKGKNEFHRMSSARSTGVCWLMRAHGQPGDCVNARKKLKEASRRPSDLIGMLTSRKIWMASESEERTGGVATPR